MTTLQQPNCTTITRANRPCLYPVLQCGTSRRWPLTSIHGHGACRPSAMQLPDCKAANASCGTKTGCSFDEGCRRSQAATGHRIGAEDRITSLADSAKQVPPSNVEIASVYSYLDRLPTCPSCHTCCTKGCRSGKASHLGFSPASYWEYAAGEHGPPAHRTIYIG